MKTKYLFYIAFIFLLTINISIGQTLINPGFENSSLTLSPWTSWGDVSIESSGFNSGNNAVFVNGLGATEQTVTLLPNTKYILSGYGKVLKNGQKVLLGVKDYGGAEKVVGFVDTKYAKNSLEFTTGKTNTTAKIFFYVESNSFAAYGDDFLIEEFIKK